MHWQTHDFINTIGKAESKTEWPNWQDDSLYNKLEESKAIQLDKYSNPLNDAERQSYVNLMNLFGDMVVSNNVTDISETLLTEDCEAFIFSSAFESSVHYSIGKTEFPSLYKHIKIFERSVKQVYIDLQKNTGFQVCNCQVSYGSEEISHYEVSVESFTIKNSKIEKYRGGFIEIVPEFQSEDLLQPSRKDIVLEKVKAINKTLAGTPNLAKFAELLNKNTEYKLWSWEDNQFFTFQKHDIVEKFKETMEQNYTIKCIVPYEVFTESQFVMATYVYYLEHKTSSQKFVWLSTSIFSFEKDFSISKIVQQGELYPEEEANVPFQAFSREQLLEKVAGLMTGSLDKTDMVYNGDIDFGCQLYRFASSELPSLGFQQGVNKLDAKLLAKVAENFRIKWMKPIDSYVDLAGPSYETVMITTYSQGEVTIKNKGERTNFIAYSMYIYENGKLYRIMQFIFDILKPIPSPFDDKSFVASNIKRKE